MSIGLSTATRESWLLGAPPGYRSLAATLQARKIKTTPSPNNQQAVYTTVIDSITRGSTRDKSVVAIPT